MNQPDSTAARTTQAAVPVAAPAQQETVPPSDRVPALAWLIAAAFVAVELAVGHGSARASPR
jgi:hypothetical protein